MLLLFAVPGKAGLPSQVQVARRFLLAIVGGQYAQAYALLAPEITAAVTQRQFVAAARPLFEQGQRFGPRIDLYKLGMRIEDAGSTRYFCAFMFKSDTLAPKPHVQLDVTFRDSAATRVLRFGLVPAPQSKPR